MRSRWRNWGSVPWVEWKERDGARSAIVAWGGRNVLVLRSLDPRWVLDAEGPRVRRRMLFAQTPTSPTHHCRRLEFIFTITLLMLTTRLYLRSVQVRKCDTRVRAVRLVYLLLPPAVHVEPVHGTTKVSQVDMTVHRVNLQSNRLVEMSR